jgi:hypothetical protein
VQGREAKEGEGAGAGVGVAIAPRELGQHRGLGGPGEREGRAVEHHGGQVQDCRPTVNSDSLRS